MVADPTKKGGNKNYLTQNIINKNINTNLNY